MFNLFVLLHLTSSLCIINTARILGVFPTPSISHQVVFRPLIQELARRGHEVVVITADPAFPNGQSPTNLTEINIHDISYNFRDDILPEVMTEFEYGKEIAWIHLEKELQKFFTLMEVQVESQPVQKLIQQKREFDVLLIEAYVRPAVAFSHIFKAPIILVSSFGATLENLEAFGAPTHPMLYPIPFRQRLYNLSLWDKLREYYYHAQYMYLQKGNEQFDNDLLKRMFGPNIPSVSELNKNIEMLFLNIHPIWMDNQPVPPGIVFIGGLHQKPKKELPQVITKALSELPYDILFKWSDDELPGKTENIKNSKWLPQSDLLRHPKVKAFVMQGGLQSTDEAITAGVPLICIPMLGDQWYNAEKYVKLKIGLKLDFLTLTKTELKNAIETVISNTSYRENIIKLRERMNDQPESSLERAVWWTEYVLRHGGARHLVPPAANMSLAEYYELELVAIVLTSLLISVIVALYIVITLRRYIREFLRLSIKAKKS